ncbi:MAG: XrtA system polysaccharide deacetylase [Desulfobacterales bacterium]
MKNFLTIDVEDYFQVAAFADIVPPDNWGAMEQRVHEPVKSVLEILDKHNVRATFFIVGWTAEKYPEIVQSIASHGHEIGCHGYWHRRALDMTPEEFREDTLKAKHILERLSGRKVTAYRAPSYSITKKTMWALDILKQEGFTTDSSIFPISHDLYGISDYPRFRHELPQKGIEEFPISTALVLGRRIPVSGGGYFRLFPYWFTRAALKRINTKEKQPFVFYIHPWEFDPGQPRFKNARLLSRFRHYNNLGKTRERFERLLSDFDFIPLPAGNGTGNT